MTQTISRTELKALIDADEPLTLIEALPKKYFEAGHLPGAINIPHDEIAAHAASRLPDKEATIIVYCANTACQNSGIGAQALIEAGYQRVKEYVEGKQDWQEAGLELVQS